MSTAWIAKQYHHIRTGGIQVVIRKVRRLPPHLVFLVAFPIWLVMVLGFRMVRPWLVVRFGLLDSERIGHFSIHPEIYLSGLDCGLGCLDKPFIDIWCFSGQICNQQLAKMWARTLHIWPQLIVWPLFRTNALLPGGEVHCIPHPDFNLRLRSICLSKNVLDYTKPHLSFLTAEEEEGYKNLHAMGLAPDQPFICFHGRDSSYLATQYSGGDFSYHDYRDVTIQNYLPAVDELTRRGYVAIRMGSKVKDRLLTSNAKVIDYANSHHQSAFMDIFLSAKCEFFLSSGSGIFCPSMSFRRPQVIVNASPFTTVLDLDSDILFIPKKYRQTSDGHYMTCQEIFDLKAHTFTFTNLFKDAGIELVENSSQEILEIVIEAEERYKGTWITTPEDEELQQSFWSSLPENHHSTPVRSRIGTSFLRNNRYLLLDTSNE